MTPRHRADVVIVGGGIAGLYLADQLHQAGRDYLLVESRDRLGGRVLSETVNGAAYDLGPAWFWAGQPRIAGLISRFELPVFEQYAQGEFRFEDAQGRIQQGRGAASMQGSFRIDGGMGTLCTALAGQIDPSRILLNTEVRQLSRSDGDILIGCEAGAEIQARSVVLAIPPRVAAFLDFSPTLPTAATKTMAAIPTWMASQAKAVILYDAPFWRDMGLSGDAMSHKGPMVEIHDASTATGSGAALFGFIGVPPDRRDQQVLKSAIVDQLIRLFGSQAASANAVLIKDWAADTNTATQADHAPMTTHPLYGLPPALAGLWDGRLIFGGTEVAATFGGYLEGALEAADAALVESMLH
ncbi:flavin monoamine oxidase family protein [Roseobacter litoralis]|uniref:flavin monoamine oxidase family protein n=1 Tax=Roseobacter litoralis TaxID=42443 RepID=UPI000160CC9D|nr:NAD(P)/FAD-dependent oxidoreductase [Roseobacter litoralis]